MNKKCAKMLLKLTIDGEQRSQVRRPQPEGAENKRSRPDGSDSK